MTTATRLSHGCIKLSITEVTLRKKGPYSELFWSVFSRNVDKYRPE